MVRQVALVGLVALGQTLVLLVAGIDLSVGAGAGLSSVIGAIALAQWGVPPWLVIPFTMAFGFFLGAINGVFVAWLRLDPFIVTLATWEIFAGLTLVITKGYPIRPLGESFTIYWKGEPFGIPVLTQDKVANKVGMNRSRVLRILAAARLDGTVQIRVTTRLSRCVELERALAERWGLTQAIVVPTPQDENQLRHIIGAEVGA